MGTAKDTVRDILNTLPDDTSIDDIQYHLYVRTKIEKSIRQADSGQLIENEDLRHRIAKWIEE